MRRHLIWSAVLGPPTAFLGGVAACFALTLLSTRSAGFKLQLGWFDWLTIAMYAVFLIYLVGIVPSVIAGFANGRLSTRLSNVWRRHLMALVIGAALGLATLLVFRRLMLEWSEALIWMAAGAVGSLVPAILASRQK